MVSHRQFCLRMINIHQIKRFFFSIVRLNWTKEKTSPFASFHLVKVLMCLSQAALCGAYTWSHCMEKVSRKTLTDCDATNFNDECYDGKRCKVQATTNDYSYWLSNRAASVCLFNCFNSLCHTLEEKKAHFLFCSNSPAHSLILNIFLATLVTFPTVHTLFFRSLLCCCCNCILEYMWCEMLCRLCHLTALSLQFSCCCYIRAQLCKWVHWSANQIHRLILINVY